MDIFNPPLCLAKELKNSWSTNLITRADSEKIPVEVAHGVPRLKMEHDPSSKEDWFACAVPIRQDWEAEDLSSNSLLRFTLYMDDPCGGLVRLEDAHGTESADFEIETAAPSGGEEHNITVALAALEDGVEKLDLSAIKLLKVIGYKGAAFYLSEIFVE